MTNQTQADNLKLLELQKKYLETRSQKDFSNLWTFAYYCVEKILRLICRQKHLKFDLDQFQEFCADATANVMRRYSYIKGKPCSTYSIKSNYINALYFSVFQTVFYHGKSEEMYFFKPHDDLLLEIEKRGALEWSPEDELKALLDNPENNQKVDPEIGLIRQKAIIERSKKEFFELETVQEYLSDIRTVKDLYVMLIDEMLDNVEYLTISKAQLKGCRKLLNKNCIELSKCMQTLEIANNIEADEVIKKPSPEIQNIVNQVQNLKKNIKKENLEKCS